MRALLLCFAAIRAVCAQDFPADLLERKLLERVRAVDESLSGTIGLAAIDLKSGRTIRYNAETLFPQASSIKIPILIEVFRCVRAGKFRLEDPVSLEQSEAVGGSGHLRILLRSRPITVSVRELAAAMIETSDNTATNKLIAMAGLDSVNEGLRAMGFTQTWLRRRMLESGAAAQDRENVSSPMEMARLAELLYRGKAVDAEASREMMEMLKLPQANFRRAIPERIPVASKPGEVKGVRTETGIVFLEKRPFVLSVMSAYLDPGENPVPELARLFYEYFDRIGRSNRYGHNLQ